MPFSRRSAVPRPLRRTVAGTVAAVLVGALGVVLAAPTQAAPIRAFDKVYNEQTNGQIALVGNTVMSCATSVAACANARAGTGSALNDNDFNMTYVDVDSNTATFDSSAATLTLPNQAEVRFAALVWMGRAIDADGSAGLGTKNSMKLQVPGSSTYTTITSSRTDTNTPGGDSTDTVYSSYADVTSLVRTAGAGSYVGADVAAGVGGDRYAGWSLVVAYRQAALPLRDLTIFNGFEQITGSNPTDTFTLTGFKAPPNGEVRARIGVVAADGDLGLTGDSLKVNGTSLSSDISAANNFFNSTNDTLGVPVTARNPAYRNNLGWDVKDIAAPGTIPNNATSATVSLTTGGEAYFPNILTTAIDLYAPNFNSQTKTVTNLTGSNPAAAGDRLQYTITHTNTGGDPATGAVVRDPLPANVTYVPGSLRVTDGANVGAKTDAAGDDQGEYVASDRLVRVRIGAGANGTAGGTLSPSSVSATAATSTISFQVTIDRAASGTTIENTALLDYTAQTLGKSFVFTGNPVSTPVGSLADLGITGTTSDTVVAGSTANYTFTVTNTGPNPAQTTVVTTTLPNGVTPTSATSSTGATCTISGQTVTCPLGTVGVNPATPPTVRVTGTVAAGTNATSVSVTGQVSSATADPDASNNTAVLSNGVGTNADLAIVFTDTPADFVPGTERSYTARITNNGPSDAANVSVTTTLPNGLSFVPANNPACTSSNGVGVCTIGTLRSGQSVSFTLSGKLASGYDDPSVAVTAAVSGSTPDAVAANNTATATSTVAAPQADVQITGTATPTTAAAGSTQQFGYTVRDNGPSDAANTVVTVPVPDGTTFVSITSRTGSCDYDAGRRVATCRLGTVPADGTSAVLLTVRVDPATTATLVSTASVSATGNTPGANDSARVTAPVTVRSDVVAQLTGDKPALSGGEVETYSLGVTNDGPAAAHDVTFTQTLPVGFTVTAGALTVPAGTTCVVTGTTIRTVTCTTALVAPGATVTVTVPARAPGTLPASVVSTATVSLATPADDPNHDNDTAEFDLTGNNSADVSVMLAASPEPVVAGGTLTYTATVRNTGPATAQDVVFTDQLPAALGADSTAVADDNRVTCTVVDRLVRCPLVDLPAGGTPVKITITGQVAASTTAAIANTASATTTTTTDPALSNNSDSVRSTVTTRADIALTQSAPATATAGQTTTWTVAVSNTGPSDAASVRVKEPLPTGWTVADFTTGGITCTSPGGVLTCVFGTVPANGTRTITVTATIAADAPAGAATLAATATTTTPQANTGNDTDSDVVTVVRAADLAITAVMDPSPVVAGNRATATYTVTNAGPSIAGATTVTVPLPTGFTAANVVAVTPSAGTCDAVQPGDTTITCRLGSVVPDSPVTVAVTLDVPSASTGTLAVTATVSSPDDATDSSATASASITADADLAVQITVSQNQVTAGSGLVYSFVVSNAGPSDATNVVLSGTLPVGVTPVRIDAPGGVICRPTSADGRSLRCDVASLTAGSSLTGALTVTTSPSLDGGTTLVNTATVMSGTPDANRTNNSATASTDVVTAAQLAVRMAAIPSGVVVPGDPYSYRITVTNSGPSDARGVRVVDTLPPGVTANSATTPQGDCTVTAGPDANSIITCVLGTLGAGAIVVNLYGVTLAADSDADSVTNNAVISSDTSSTPGGTTPQRINSSLTTPVQPVADVVIAKKASADSLAAGSPITYTLTVSNPEGPSSSPVSTVTDVVPAAVTGVTPSAPTGTSCTTAADSGAAGGTRVTCSVGRIDVGDEVAITITGTIAGSVPAGRLSNTATVAVAGDPDTSDNTATADVDVTVDADLSVQVTPVATTATPGTTTSYRVTVSNGGPSEAAAPTVIIPVPAGLTGATVTLADGTDAGCTLTTGGYSCKPAGAGVMVSGASVVYVVTGTIDAAATGTLDEAASVSSTTTDSDGTDNATSKSVTLIPRADLFATKSVDPDVLVPGDPATYTISVRNDGPSVAHSVTVDDSLQAGQTVGTPTVSGATGSCSKSGRVVSCSIPALAPTVTAVVTIPVTVASNFDGTSYSNTAVVSSPDETDPSDNTPVVSGTTAPKADLRVTAKATPQDVGQSDDAAVPGTRVTYDLTVTNDGPSDAVNVRLLDTLPAGATIVSASGTGWTCDVRAVPLTCTRPALADGDSASLTVVVTLPGSATGTASSSVSVSSGIADPVSSDNSDRVVLALEPFSDLITDKTVTPAVPTAGGAATYVVTVRNDGPSDAPGVVVTDALQDGQTATGVTLTGADATCSVDTGAGAGTGGVVRCVLADPLPDGATVTMRVQVRFAADYASGSFTNTAAATSPARGQTPGAGIDEVNGPIARRANLSVTKSGPATATPGGSITWQVDVRNSGPSAATDVVVLDALPEGVTAGSATTDVAGSVCSLGATVTCSVPAIAANATARVTIVGTIASGASGSLVNRATAIAGNSVDPDDTDNTSAPVETSLVRAAGLVVTKTATPATLVAGSTARYDIVVRSSGQSDATDVVITDPMPTGITATAATVDGGTCEVGTTVRCTVATLAAGTSTTVRIDVRIAERASGTIVNRATATSPDSPADGTGQVSSPVRPLAFLTITKTADRTRVEVGSEVRYTVTVRNTGTAAATDVVVADRLPAGLKLVSSAPAPGRYDAETGQWRIDVLATGATATLRMTAEVTEAGRIVNIASIDPATPGVTDATRPSPAAAPVTGVAVAGTTPPPSGSAPTSDGGTADTGTRVAQAVGLAALLLALGFGLMVVARRRREEG